MVELNNHVILGHIDKPARILFWSVKQFGCCTLPVFLGMVMDRLVLDIAMSIAAMVLFKVFSKYFGNRGFATILYWYFPTSSRLMKLGIPPSHVRIWSKAMRLSQVSKKLDDIISTLLENKAPDHTKLAEVYHLSRYLPYKWYDDRNDIYISDTSLGLIFEVMPLGGNSEAMQKELSNIFTQILPEESNIQIMFFASKNIKDDLLNYVYSRQNSTDTLRQLATRRAQFLNTLTQRSHLYPYVLRDFRVFVSITIPNGGNFKNAKDEIISIKKLKKQY